MGKSSFTVPLTFHTEYSPVIRTQLDTGATCSAMSYTDLLTMSQSGEVELDPPGGKIRLSDGRVVGPLGSYTITVSLNSGSEGKISFDILENAPWPIVDGNTCIKQGWISLGSDQFLHSLNSEKYEPPSFGVCLKVIVSCRAPICTKGKRVLGDSFRMQPFQSVPAWKRINYSEGRPQAIGTNIPEIATLCIKTAATYARSITEVQPSCKVPAWSTDAHR